MPKNHLINRYADDVSPGYEVLIDENDQLTITKVINISSSRMQGKVHFE